MTARRGRGAEPASDFADTAWDHGPAEEGTRFEAVGMFGLDRRKYRRIALEAPATVRLGQLAHEGPCDVSRGGAGVIVPLSPTPGTPVEVELPPDAVDTEGLVVRGHVARVQTIVEPIERGGKALPTFHCFTCGWTGFFDPITGELATTVRRHSDSTFGATTRLRATNAAAGQPDACPICGGAEPTHTPEALYRIGIRLDRLGLRDEERLAQYVERAVVAQAGLGRRVHKRALAEYVPVKIECSFASAGELANTYLKDISQGGIGFTSTEDLALGAVVRIAIHGPRAAAPLVLSAEIVSRQPAGQATRYGARFVGFHEATRKELRDYVEHATEAAVSKAERAQHRSRARRWLGRELWLGLTLGIVIALSFLIVSALGR